MWCNYGAVLLCTLTFLLVESASQATSDKPVDRNKRFLPVRLMKLEKKVIGISDLTGEINEGVKGLKTDTSKLSETMTTILETSDKQGATLEYLTEKNEKHEDLLNTQVENIAKVKSAGEENAKAIQANGETIDNLNRKSLEQAEKVSTQQTQVDTLTTKVDKNSNDFERINGKVNSNADTVAAHTNALSKLTEESDAGKAKDEEMSKTVEEMDTKVTNTAEAVQRSDNKLDNFVVEYNEKNENHGKETAAIKERLSKSEASISSTKGKLTNMKEEFEQIKQGVSENSDDVNALNTLIGVHAARVDSVNNIVKEQADVVARVKTTIEEANGKVVEVESTAKNLDDRIKETENAIAQDKSKLNELTDKVNSDANSMSKKTVDELEQRTKEIQDTLNGNDERITKNEGSVNKQGSLISDLKASVSKHDSKIEEHWNQLREQTYKVGGMTSKLSNYDRRMDDMQSTATRQSAQVTKVEKMATAYDTAIKASSSRTSDNAAKIKTLLTRAYNSESVIKRHNTALFTHDITIAKLQRASNDVASKQSQQQRTISGVDSKVKSYSSKISGLETRLSSQEQAMNTQKSKSATNGQSIQYHSTQINSYNKRITDLANMARSVQGKVTKVEKDVVTINRDLSNICVSAETDHLENLRLVNKIQHKNDPSQAKTPRNIKFKVGSAKQVDTYWSNWPSRAFDNLPGNSYASGSCTNTWSHAFAWWFAELETLSTVYQVKLSNRGDCCGDRLSNFYIETFMDQPQMTGPEVRPRLGKLCVYYRYAVRTGETQTFTCAGPGPARFVRVMLLSRNYLSLCNVAVVGIPVDQFQADQTLQSSVQVDAAQSSSGYAVDGNAATCSLMMIQKYADIWYQIDIQAIKTLRSYTIRNSNALTYTWLQDFEAALYEKHPTKCATNVRRVCNRVPRGQPVYRNSAKTLYCANGTRGRFFRIEKKFNVKEGLVICELSLLFY